MSQDIEDTLNPYRVQGVLGFGPGAAEWLVVAGWIDGELAGGGVEDLDVQLAATAPRAVLRTVARDRLRRPWTGDGQPHPAVTARSVSLGSSQEPANLLTVVV
jgi:hypothetical protein